MKGRYAVLGFLVLLIAQLALLSSQARYPERRQPALEGRLLETLAPVSRVVSGALGLAERLDEALRSHSRLREKVQALEARLHALQMEHSRLSGMEEELERLSNALGYRPAFEGELRLADVVYIDHSSWLQTLLLYLPGRAAVDSSPVTAPRGLVGRVILSRGPYAKVQLITDRASGVGGMIERTRRQGIVRGAGRDGLTLEYVPLQADVRVGDKVVTSGTDGLYPRGIDIGAVLEVAPGTELFHSIRLAPAVDFGVLDQVFVLMGDTLPGRLKGTKSASP